MADKDKGRCEAIFKSMVLIVCSCGFRAHNEKLKGKKDKKIAEETMDEFLAHITKNKGGSSGK